MTDKAIEAALNAWVNAPKHPYNLLPAMRAAIAAYEQASWRPIEEAPIGERVLLYNKWSSPPVYEGIIYFGMSGQPTHYRPLPPQPGKEG